MNSLNKLELLVKIKFGSKFTTFILYKPTSKVFVIAKKNLINLSLQT
jgi:hypothetical protein